MAGRSRYQIVLTGDERAELEHRAACYSRASETLLRLYLAHCDDDPCPSLQVARQRCTFKTDVKAV